MREFVQASRFCDVSHPRIHDDLAHVTNGCTNDTELAVALFRRADRAAAVRIEGLVSEHRLHYRARSRR